MVIGTEQIDIEEREQLVFFITSPCLNYIKENIFLWYLNLLKNIINSLLIQMPLWININWLTPKRIYSLVFGVWFYLIMYN